jgi:hypothetical protein
MPTAPVNAGSVNALWRRETYYLGKRPAGVPLVG